MVFFLVRNYVCIVLITIKANPFHVGFLLKKKIVRVVQRLPMKSYIADSFLSIMNEYLVACIYTQEGIPQR